MHGGHENSTQKQLGSKVNDVLYSKTVSKQNLLFDVIQHLNIYLIFNTFTLSYRFSVFV